jgi:hypothetical protein
MRQEYMTDEKGRRVRVMHPAPEDGATGFLWDDMRTAPREHMQAAFLLRRHQIVDDCKQLKTDVDSYNDAHSANEPIQMVFDFRNDLAEAEAVTASYANVRQPQSEQSSSAAPPSTSRPAPSRPSGRRVGRGKRRQGLSLAQRPTP